jgi:hypothetical protein
MKTMRTSGFFSVMLASLIASLLVWQVLFQNNPVLKPALIDIHLIFLATLSSYVFFKMLAGEKMLEFIKITTRTIFRVWLLIVITFTVSKTTERVGYLLSITFIFGYLESLLDIDRWSKQVSTDSNWVNTLEMGGKKGQILFTLTIINGIHIIGAIVVQLFYQFLM